MSSISQIGRKGLSRFRKQFLNLSKLQVTTDMENKSDRFLRDGIRNDYPDFLIKTVSDSPNAIAVMRKLQGFVQGRGIADENLSDFMVNESETFDELHAKIAKDLAFAERFAIKIVPNLGGGIDKIYHIPFEAVRFGLPDEFGKVHYVAVNYLFNTFDYKISDTRHYPIFELKKGLTNWRQEAEQQVIDFEREEYTGHVYFYSATSEKNRTYSRPSYFAAQDYMKVDFKLGEFHNRNTDNNFFLGGVLTVVGDPDAVIYNEDGSEYSTAGQEFKRELANTFSGTDQAGRIMIDWVDAPEDATKVTAWPGNTHHELFTVLEGICEDRISKSMGLPKILLGVPTSGKLGDSQEIRNAINFTNENTEHYRRKLESTYNVLVDLMPVPTPEDGVVIERIKDFTDLSDAVLNRLSPSQLEKYLQDNFGIEPSEDEPEPEIIIENGDITNIDE